jgi:hypothetical protein
MRLEVAIPRTRRSRFRARSRSICVAICASNTRPTVPGPINPMDKVFGDK